MARRNKNLSRFEMKQDDKHQTWEVQIITAASEDTHTFEIVWDANVGNGLKGHIVTLGDMEFFRPDIFDAMAEMIRVKYDFTDQQLLFEVLGAVNRIK